MRCSTSRVLPKIDVWYWAPDRQGDLSALTLPVGRVDVWQVNLDEHRDQTPETGVLSLDEVIRSERFRYEKDRLRFVRCRSVLRELLGGYLKVPAAEIRFTYLRYGKPELAAAQNPFRLRFSVSHSENRAVLAFAVDHRLGVDIEKIRTGVDVMALAEQFFCLREREGLRRLPADLCLRAFFACWTRKESFSKATGDGLSLPLSDFTVTTHPDRDPRLEDIRGDKDAARTWLLTDLDAPPGFQASMTVEEDE